MYWKKVSRSRFWLAIWMLMTTSFAWMEILKAVVTVFKLFDVKRMNPKPTVVREGFFNKAVECKVEIRRRHFS
jgi:benzoate 4-monooxygenase